MVIINCLKTKITHTQYGLTNVPYCVFQCCKHSWTTEKQMCMGDSHQSDENICSVWGKNKY